MNQGSSVPLAHLDRLTDDIGIFEHAQLDEPRRNVGYCTDDAGRLLALGSDAISDRPESRRLATVSLQFLRRAFDGEGFRLRLGPGEVWTDDPSSDDATARALHGLGTAAARAPWDDVRHGSLELFEEASRFRSSYLRAGAHALLGATAVLAIDSDSIAASRVAEWARVVLDVPGVSAEWPWPESRLTYSNAIVPHALLALAHVREAHDDVARALQLLEWLVDVETLDDHFSFTPVAGRGPRTTKVPEFDQQPIEAWTMASACECAYEVTGLERWASRASRAALWFTGLNDTGTLVYDPRTGAGFDGLQREGVNLNRGAESTIAAVGAMTILETLAASPAPSGDRQTSVNALSNWGTDATAAPTHRSAAPYVR